MFYPQPCVFRSLVVLARLIRRIPVAFHAPRDFLVTILARSTGSPSPGCRRGWKARLGSRNRRFRLAIEPLGTWLALSNALIPPIAGYVPAQVLTPNHTAIAPPAQPVSLKVTAQSDTEVNLTWERGDDDDQAIVVERRTGATGGFSLLATLPAHSDIFTDTSCYPNQTYAYRVSARNTAGTSAVSAEQSVTTPASQASLAAPAAVQVQATSSASVQLSFRDSNPYTTRPDLLSDPSRVGVVSSASAPFTAADVGKTLNITARAWWTLTVDPGSQGQVISDQKTPFTAADLGTVLNVDAAPGWTQGSYRIIAVDGSGKATLSSAAAKPGTTTQGSARDGWQSGAYKITAVDGAGGATLSTAPTNVGNLNRAAAVSGTLANQGIYTVERSSDGVAYQIVADFPNSSSTMSWGDTYLDAGTTYYYRVRLSDYYGGIGDYSSPVSVVTAAQPAGVPAVPTNLAVTNLSAQSNSLTWTNPPGNQTAVTRIERAVYSWTGSPVWAQVAVVQPGTSSFTDSTVSPESFYYYRVRAGNSAGYSNATTPVVARTASPGTGTAKVYQIGPGRAYTSLAALDWSRLGPGDVVQIYPNKDASGSVIPYREHLLISVRGTAGAPIRIVGMADPVSGVLPIIDSQGATTAAQFASHYTPLEGNALLIGTRPNNNTVGWNPGYLDISGLTIRGAYQGDSGGLTYTNSQGQVVAYDPSAAGIYLEKADDVSIRDSIITGNGNGIFGAAQGDDRELAQILLDGDYVHDNGNPGRDREHEIYMEGVDVTYQNNRIGPTHGGGSALKDRSVGTVIRNNWIQGGGHLLDLVEAQNQLARALTMPGYSDTYVTGNVFYNPGTGGSVSPIHYGGDQGMTAFYRKGVLHFEGNTFLNRRDQAQSWSTTLFALSSPGESVDARRNILSMVADTANQPASELDLLPGFGAAYFGQNWVSPAWQVSKVGAGAFQGVIVGTSRFITTAGNFPASIDIAALDARIRGGYWGPAPVAVADTLTTSRAAVVPLLSNDSGDGIHVVSVTQGRFGSVVIRPDGSVVYSPNPGTVGRDSFSYTIVDAHGATASATVSVSIVQTNTGPIISPPRPGPTSTLDPPALKSVTMSIADPAGRSTAIGSAQPMATAVRPPSRSAARPGRVGVGGPVPTTLRSPMGDWPEREE